MSKSKALALAEKLGVTVTDEGGTFVLETEARTMFAGYFQHGLVIDYAGHGLTKTVAWREVIEDLQSGVAPCTIEACDYCTE